MSGSNADPATARPPAARPLLALAHAGMFTFGLVMALIGAVVPTLTGTLSLTLGNVGTMFLAMNFAMLMASLLVGLVMDRGGLKLPLVGGAWLVAVALVLIGRATSYPALLPAVACLGFGGGALNTGTNTLVADLHDDPARKAAALNLLGVFFGFGALVLPLSIGILTSRLGVPSLLFAAATVSAAIGALAAMRAFPAPKQQHEWPLAQLPRFAALPLVRVAALLLFFQSGNEFLLGGYTATFLTRDMRLTVAAASYALAAYWGAIMLARAVLSRALLRVSAPRVVVWSALAGAIGAIVTALAPGPGTAVAGALLTATALAGIFPSALGAVGARFEEHSGTVFGILFTAALCGGMTIPWVAGHLADAAGLRWVFVLAAANSVVVAAAMITARRWL
jgi:fucose permease